MLLTDAQLVQAVLQGDTPHFEELVFRYEKKIFQMAYSFSFQTQTAEDLTQDIFLRAFQKLHLYNPQYPFCSWILTLTMNYLINQQKKQKIKPLSFHSEENFQQIPAPPEESKPLFSKFEEKLAVALNQLNELHQKVFRLYHFQGMSYQEIADVLEKPLNTIKTYLFRSRAELRALLKEELET